MLKCARMRKKGQTIQGRGRKMEVGIEYLYVNLVTNVDIGDGNNKKATISGTV